MRGIHPSITIKAAERVEPEALEQAVKQAVIDAGAAGQTFAVKAIADGTVQLNGEVTNEWVAVERRQKVAGSDRHRRLRRAAPGQRVRPRPKRSSPSFPLRPSRTRVLKTKVEEALKTAGLEGMSLRSSGAS